MKIEYDNIVKSILLRRIMLITPFKILIRQTNYSKQLPLNYQSNIITTRIQEMGNCLNGQNTQNRYTVPSPQQPHIMPHAYFSQKPPQIVQPAIYTQTPQFRLDQTQLNQGMLKLKYGHQCRKCQGQTIQVKIPQNTSKTKYHCISQPIWLFPLSIANYSIEQIKYGCFQQKMTWLRMKMQKTRVSWQDGCQKLHVDRHNVLMSSLNALQNMNLKKQIKIQFDQEDVNDAGGVLREWMHLSIKQIFSHQSSGLFQLCNTEETAYRFIVDSIQTEDQKQFKLQVIKILGIIIGKAIFQRISLNCFLTKSLWRQICGQKIQKCDFYSYDKQMYNNCEKILNQTNAEQLGCNFSYLITETNRQSQLIQLKQNGNQIWVDDSNKQEYVNLLIKYFCVDSCKHYIETLKESINRVFPVSYLSIFQPHEMEMLVNGPSTINVDDWKKSTKYNGYTVLDKQVQWFWDYISKLDQKKLGNLLHYTTGSRRVPVLGFFFLQSNRNQICRFLIEKVEYDRKNPYPKSHTCFNRLELPNYKTREKLQKMMEIILSNQINSFGLN